MTHLSAFNLPAIGLLLHGLRSCGEILVRRLFLQRDETSGEASLRDPGPGPGSGSGPDLDLVLDPEQNLDPEYDLDADGETGRRLPPFQLTDISPDLESTRMRLFVLTGQYWRGS